MALGVSEDQDPLEILLHEEAVKEVKTNRRLRGVKSRQWWRDLLEYGNQGPQSRPETAG